MRVDSFERGDAEGSVVLWLHGDDPGRWIDFVSLDLPGGLEEFRVQEVRRAWDEEDDMLCVVVLMAWDDRDLTLAEADVLAGTR